MRRFRLNRKKDLTGISGTGYVANGVEFDTGRVVMEWAVEPYTIAIHTSMDALIAVHGHGDSTVIEWQD